MPSELLNSSAMPKLGVQSVALTGMNAQTVSAVATLSVSNPSPIALPLSGVQYQLQVAGKNVASGNYAQQQTLAAGASSTLRVPIDFAVTELATLLPALLTGTSAPYSLSGSLGLPLLAVPFSHSGVLSLPK